MMNHYKRVGSVLAICLIAIGCLFALRLSLEGWIVPAPVEAQGGGSANFTRTFTLAASASAQYIPACTTSGTNCIPNYTQVSHQVVDVFGTPGSAAACGVLLDGSADNTHFYTIGALNQAGLGGNPSTFASGYWPYVRIKALPCASSAQTITYVGLSTPVEKAASSQSEESSAVGAFTALGTFYVPYTITGFQAFNPNASTAYLMLDINPGTTCSGVVTFNYQVGIAAGQTFIYTGAPLSPYSLTGSVGTQTICAGAFTTAGGSTPVGSTVIMNVQTTPGGPFYPFLPPSS